MEDFRRTDDKAAETAGEEEIKAEARAPGECGSGVDEGAKDVRPPAPPKQGGAGEAVPPADGEYPGGNAVVLTQPGSGGSQTVPPTTDDGRLEGEVLEIVVANGKPKPGEN